MADERKPPSLPELMARLPQELFDPIYDYTFHIPPVSGAPSITRISVATYKPPPILQVCRAIRSKLAVRYYKNREFEGRANQVVLWARSLPHEHAKMIQEIRVWYFNEDELKEDTETRILSRLTPGLMSLPHQFLLEMSLTSVPRAVVKSI